MKWLNQLKKYSWVFAAYWGEGEVNLNRAVQIYFQGIADDLSPEDAYGCLDEEFPDIWEDIEIHTFNLHEDESLPKSVYRQFCDCPQIITFYEGKEVLLF